MKFLAIFSTTIFLGYLVAYPAAWALMLLDEYEINRDITRGERNVR